MVLLSSVLDVIEVYSNEHWVSYGDYSCNTKQQSPNTHKSKKYKRISIHIIQYGNMNLQTGPDESIRDHLFLHIYRFLSN